MVTAAPVSVGWSVASPEQEVAKILATVTLQDQLTVLLRPAA